MDLAEDALELLILLPLPAEHWEYRCIAHTRFYVVLRMGPGALHVLSKPHLQPRVLFQSQPPVLCYLSGDDYA